jgi:anaerobic selenocysteine-containing dehydrogenase
VANLDGGVYYYHPSEHSLVAMAPGAEIEPDVHEPLINRAIFEQAAFSIFLITQLNAIEPLYECKSDLTIFSLLADKLGFGEYFNKTPEDYIRLLLDTQKVHDLGVTYESLKKDGAFRAPPSPHIPYKDGKFNTPSGRIEFYNETIMSRSSAKELEYKREVILQRISDSYHLDLRTAEMEIEEGFDADAAEARVNELKGKTDYFAGAVVNPGADTEASYELQIIKMEKKIASRIVLLPPA